MCRAALGLALVLGAAGIMAGSAWISTPFGHSQHFNLAWVAAFGEVFWQGVPYPRHLPGQWDGLGGLDLFYYPPLGFWITELLGRPLCRSCNDADVLALGGGAMLILSGAVFYAAAWAAIGRRGALAGALVYMVLPYHLWIDWFHRQALGEFAAYIAAPALMFGALAVLRGGRGGMLALGWAGLLLAHLPTALLAGHLLAVVVIVWIGLALWARRGAFVLPLLARGVAATLVGFALAAPFWMPAVALLGDVSPDMLYSPVYDAERWLFLDGVDAPVPAFQTLLVAAMLANAAAVLMLGWLAGDRPAMILMVAVPLVLTVIGMSALTRPVWIHWIIELAQFPWRLMLFADLAVATAVSLALQARPWRRWPISARLLPMAAIAAATALALPETIARVQQGEDFSTAEITMGGTTEYVPKPMLAVTGADRFSQHREVEIALLDLAARIQADPAIVQGDLTHRRFSVDLPGQAADLVLALPYWPHWRGPQGVTLSADSETGMTRAQVPAGIQRLVLTLPWHWSEWAGYAALLAGLAGLGILVMRRPALLAGRV